MAEKPVSRPAFHLLFGTITGDRNMSKQIPLTQGKFAIVDDADFEWVNQWKWYAKKAYNTWYAVRNSQMVNGKRTGIRMHRVILGLNKGDSSEVDHKNHNGLDNRKDNIRICTHSQNQRNKICRIRKSSLYKGVHWSKTANKWCAQIRLNGIRTHLGLFDLEMHAVNAYDKAAKKYHGEFSHANFYMRTELVPK